MTPEARALLNLTITYTLDFVCFIAAAACCAWLIWVANHNGRVE